MVPLNAVRARRYLAVSDLRSLFREELGWDNSRFSTVVPAGDAVFRLTGVGEACDVLALEVGPGNDGRIPPAATRAELQRRAFAAAREHLLVFTNAERTQMLWQPPVQPVGSGRNVAAHRCFTSEIGEGLMQILRQLCLSDWPQNRRSLVQVASAVSSAFKSERFEYYYDYYRRLAHAEGEAGLQPAPARRSIWNYTDSIASADFDDADYHCIGNVLGPAAAARLRPPLALDTTWSPANRSTRLFVRGSVRADLLIADGDGPEDEAFRSTLAGTIAESLASLTPREARVLRLRFGLADGYARTLEEVGQKFGVTRERIRQIASKALRKLRHPSRSRRLQPFLDGPGVQLPVVGGPEPVATVRLREPQEGEIRRFAGSRTVRAPWGLLLFDSFVRVDAVAVEARRRLAAEAARLAYRAELRARFGSATARPVLSADESVSVPSAGNASEELRAAPGSQSPPVSAHTPPSQPDLGLPGLFPLFDTPPPTVPTTSATPPSAGREQLPLMPGLTDAAEPDQRSPALAAALRDFRFRGFEVEDLRSKGGALWVHDPGTRLRAEMDALRAVGVQFQQSKHRKTWGWWTK